MKSLDYKNQSYLIVCNAKPVRESEVLSSSQTSLTTFTECEKEQIISLAHE